MDIWDRKQGESNKAYRAFCIYRDMGIDRSLKRVGEELKISGALAGRWSSRYGWVARAQAWDDRLDAEAQKAKIKAQAKAREEMTERHAKLAKVLQSKVVERLQNLNPRELSPGDVAKWVDVAVKVERLSYGEPTENVDQRVSGEVSMKGDEELAKRIVEDPEASRLAVSLIARIANSEVEPGGVRACDE
jgi:hypothetical protein